jgi:hypothetical protein
MSDRPTAANGKRNQAWGTTSACPGCGECLCFGCHPHGPCVDEHESAAAPSAGVSETAGFRAWTFTSEGSLGVPALQLRSR